MCAKNEIHKWYLLGGEFDKLFADTLRNSQNALDG